MLNSLTLTNFRQFESKHIAFGEGSTVIRGENEGGKSTIVEAFLYLNGGARACRNSDFVRWGEKPTSCKVEGIMTLQGTQVKAKRSKSGAELYIPHNAAEPTIVGQTEVTDWFAAQLGAPLDVAQKMFLAKQADLGGIFAENNGKAVEFIEGLSGLDIVEFFITQIQITNKVGSTDLLAQRLQQDMTQLQNQEAFDYENEIIVRSTRVEPLETELHKQRAGLEALEKTQKDLRTEQTAVTRYAANLSNAQRAAQDEIENLRDADADLVEAKTALSSLSDVEATQASLKRLEAAQENVERLNAMKKAKAAFDAWPEPELEWDEGREALDTVLNKAKTEVKFVSGEIASYRETFASLKAKLVTSSVCGMCGEDVSKFPGVAEKNSKIEAELGNITNQLEVLAKQKFDAQADVDTYEGILAAPTFKLAHSRPDLFEIDEKYVPFRVKWIPGALVDAEDVSGEVAKLKAAIKSHAAATSKVASCEAIIVSATKRHVAAKASLAMLESSAPKNDAEFYRVRIESTDEALITKREQVASVSGELRELQGTLDTLRRSAKIHAEGVASLKTAIAATEAELEQYEFHNELIEDLRKARPIVANRLWNMVTHAVSTYATRMRQTASILTREGKVFMVNGKPASSYSGSALDVFALGIRVALTKIFVPGADMMVLDEPFAACSEARTAECFAFAVSSGFAQTIIITHESGTENLVANIIEV